MPRSPLPVAVYYRDYSLAELWADGIIHVVGVTLALAGSVILSMAMLNEGAIDGAYTSTAIYLLTLLLSMGMSAVYNVWPVSPIKRFLRRFDHSAIYLLIAGTYTPFMVKCGTWWLLAVVWSIAACGVVLKLTRPNEFDRLSIGLYLALGWSGMAVYQDVQAILTPSVLWLIVAGGVAYSLGVFFHVLERLPFHNAIWHALVVVGAGIHFAAVCRVVA